MNKKLLGVRIPESLIHELKAYCRKNGILMNYFVANAINEKLKDISKREEKKIEEKAIEEKK